MIIREWCETPIDKNRKVIAKRIDTEILSPKFVFSIMIFGPIKLIKNSKSMLDILVKLLNKSPSC